VVQAGQSELQMSNAVRKKMGFYGTLDIVERLLLFQRGIDERKEMKG
jgi:hypothetical protein